MIEMEAPREILSGGRVKGFLCEARTRWLADYYGERIVRRVLSALPAHIAADIELAHISGWCRFETLVALDGAIVEISGRSGRELLRDLGRYAAHISVTKTPGPNTLHRFFRSTALRDALFQESARGVYEDVGPTHGRLSIVAAPCFSAAWCEAAAGYLEQVTVIHEASHPEVTISSCRASGDEICSFDIRWQ
jgi:predicted hydrocarbon binding protein